MKQQLKVLGLFLALAVVGVVWAVEETSSRTASGTTESVILFDSVKEHGWTVTGVNADSDLTTAKIVFQGRLASTAMSKVTSNVSSTATIVHMTPTTGISSNDIVYFKPTAISPGFIATAAVITATSVTLHDPGLVTNLVVGDVAYEINKIHTLDLSTGATGVVERDYDGQGLVYTVGDSPLRARLTGTATNELSIAVKKERR